MTAPNRSDGGKYGGSSECLGGGVPHGAWESNRDKIKKDLLGQV